MEWELGMKEGVDSYVARFRSLQAHAQAHRPVFQTSTVLYVDAEIPTAGLLKDPQCPALVQSAQRQETLV